MALMGGKSEFFGIDIGTNAIRVVQLASGATRTLKAYGYVPLDPQIARSEAPTDQQKLAGIISKLLGDSRVSTKNVVSGLSTKHVYTATINLPNITEQEISKTITYQAEQYIPVALDTVKLDWAQIGQTANGEKEILLVAAQKSASENRLELLESIGLDVLAIEPDPIALTRSLLPTTYGNPAVIVDMGADSTDVVIVYQGAPHLIRSLSIGSDALIKAAAKSFDVDNNQAAEFVFKFGLTKSKLEGQVFKALQGTVDNLVSEVKKSINFFQSKKPGVTVEKVVITGNAASIPELPLYVANATNLPVEIGNTWTNVVVNPGLLETLNNVSSQFSVVTGLALRDDI